MSSLALHFWHFTEKRLHQIISRLSDNKNLNNSVRNIRNSNTNPGNTNNNYEDGLYSVYPTKP